MDSALTNKTGLVHTNFGRFTVGAGDILSPEVITDIVSSLEEFARDANRTQLEGRLAVQYR
ncbi:MAG: hypothetical protein KDD53_02620 [Bdellovibrionales bacterium]|nr:hypothetical protein [Bdellovibrionales bacterium]